MLTVLCVGVHENALEQQSGSHPERRVIETDQTVDVRFCIAVIPGTHRMFFQTEPLIYSKEKMPSE